MGFVQFPGSDTEPAKSGPGVAQRLAQVYKEYLLGFDQVYINSVIESRRKMHATAVHNAQVGGNNPSQPQPFRFNPQQMQIIIGYANKSVGELRTMGVQEKVISFVETNRAYLQRTVIEQGLFRGQFQSQGLRPPDQLGIANQMNAFSGPSTQPNPNSVSRTLPQQFSAQPNGMMQVNRGLQHPQGHPLLPNGGGPSTRPTKQQMDMANALIQKTKQEFAQNSEIFQTCLSLIISVPYLSQ